MHIGFNWVLVLQNGLVFVVIGGLQLARYRRQRRSLRDLDAKTLHRRRREARVYAGMIALGAAMFCAWLIVAR